MRNDHAESARRGLEVFDPAVKPSAGLPQSHRRNPLNSGSVFEFAKALEKGLAEEALEKRLVSMFLHYNEGIRKRKVRCWREIVAYYESK